MHEWRPPKVADYVRIKGSGRYAPGQSDEGALADLSRECQALEKRHPGLRASVRLESTAGRLTKPSFEVARDNPIVHATNAAYVNARPAQQPTGAITPPAFYRTHSAHPHRLRPL